MPSPSDPDRVHIHYLRPPDRCELFVQELVHDDGRVKVTFAGKIERPDPVVYRNRVILEAGADVVWFTFPGAWHDIARFHRADGTFTGIYANVLVPCTFEAGEDWHTTDLFLDLWIPANERGWTFGQACDPWLLDADELAEAESKGWISPILAERARGEAGRLMREARRGRWPPRVVEEWTRERVRSRGRRARPDARLHP